MVTHKSYNGKYEIREYWNYGCSNQRFTKKTYLVKGVVHREDGPAIEHYTKRGKKVLQWVYEGEMYYQEIYFSNGKLKEMSWWKNKVLHREDNLPAKIYWLRHYKEKPMGRCTCNRCNSPDYYYCSGLTYEYVATSRHERWYINGKLHRENKPAKIGYKKDKPYYYYYYIDGKLSNSYSYAVSNERENAYYINDKKYTEAEFNKVLNKITLLHKFNSMFDNYEKYLVNSIIKYL